MRLFKEFDIPMIISSFSFSFLFLCQIKILRKFPYLAYFNCVITIEIDFFYSEIVIPSIASRYRTELI